MSDKTHSRFGGSIAARWMNCAGSVALNAGLPNNSGDVADAGNAAHSLAYQCATRNAHPNAFLGKTMPGYPKHPVTEEMCDAAVQYLNVVDHEIARSKTSEAFFEREFKIEIAGAEKGEIFGTNDCLVYHPELKRLRVFDYKHGYQIVDVEDNAQLKFYALGALRSNPEWVVQEIVLTIVAPNARDAYDASRVTKDWTFNRIELLEFAGDVEAAVKRAKQFEADGHSSEPVLALGPWCDNTYCNAKAAGTCPAVMAQAGQIVGIEALDVRAVTPDSLPKVESLDMEDLARVRAGIDFLSTWARKCSDYFDGLILAGHSHPGFKIVDSVGRAKWVDDPTKVAGYLDMMFGIPADQTMPPKLVTITEAEKRLKAAGATKADIDTFKLKFTVKESSGRVVAPVSDRRPAVDPGADFAGVNTTAIAAE